MSNTLLTTSYITNTALAVLENNLVFANNVDRQYSAEFAVKEAKIGATVNVRRPPRFTGTWGPALNVENTTESYIPVSLNSQFHIDVQFTTADLLLSMDRFKERVLKPVVAQVANRIDSDGMFFSYQQTAQSLGTPGTALATYLPFAQARAYLVNEGAPKSMIPTCILDPLTMAAMSDGVKGLYNPQAKIGEYLSAGLIAKNFAGLDWYEDQNVVTWTTGAQGGTPVLVATTHTGIISSGWAQSGVIETGGWTNSTAVIKVGDVIQIAGVYPANPQNRTQYTSTKKQFVVLPPGGYTSQPNGTASSAGLAFATATPTNGTFNAATGVYTSKSDGTLSITIGECVITGGQFQNCATDANFTTTAALTINGGTGNAAKASPQGIVFHRNAFALAFADLPLPRGVEDAARASDADVGMSMRMVTAYTINNDAMPTRTDVLYGYAGLYRNQAIRLASG